MKWILTNIKILIFFFLGNFVILKNLPFWKRNILLGSTWEVTVIFSEVKPTNLYLNSVVGYCSMLFEIWVRERRQTYKGVADKLYYNNVHKLIKYYNAFWLSYVLVILLDSEANVSYA